MKWNGGTFEEGRLSRAGFYEELQACLPGRFDRNVRAGIGSMRGGTIWGRVLNVKQRGLEFNLHNRHKQSFLSSRGAGIFSYKE